MLTSGVVSGPRKGRRVQVLAPREPDSTFPNGYAGAVLCLLPAALVTGTTELQRFIIPFAVTLPQLRLHPDGLVRSPFGWDIRFETRSGVQLPHQVRSYDYGTGELRAKLQLTGASPTLDNFVVLYFGKTGLVAAEEDVETVWADSFMAVDTLTGEDWSGHGRAMTATAITAGTLLGPCGRFDGTTSLLALADASWLSGRSNLTLKLTRQADAEGDDQRLVHQGALALDDIDAGLSLQNVVANSAVRGRIRTAVTAPADPYALITANYVGHLPAVPGTASVTWLTGPSYPNGGVRIKAGDTAAQSKDARIWGKTAAPTGDHRRTYVLRQLDTLTSFTSAGTFALSIHRYRGTVSGVPASPATWPTSQYQGVTDVEDASDSLYRLKGKGHRTSMAQDSTDPSRSGQVRDRTYDGPGDTAIEPVTPNPQPADHMRIDPGVDYLFVEDLIGQQLTVTRTRLSDGQVRSVLFDNAALGPSGLGVGGYPGWAAANGRHVEIRPYGDEPIIQALPVVEFDPAATVLSDGNRQTTSAQTIHLTWQQGAAPVMHVDGQRVTAADSDAQSALTSMATGALYLGPDFTGLLDEVYFRERLSDAWCALEGGMLADQAAFLAAGAVDLALDAIASPVARPTRATTERNVAVSVPVAAQGFDPAGNALTLSAVSGAVNGSVAIVSGQARFTPTTNFVGRASFDFTITNGAKSSTGRCVVTVTSPTVPPVDARADAISVLKDGSITFDPRANDLPATGLTITAVSAPTHGVASIRSAGAAILYTPTPGYTGADSFTYTVGDGLTADTATISVTVSEPTPTTEYPTPASTVTVGTMARLQEEIASASGSAWKRIICEDGTYSGTLSVGKAKVQVYSENLNGAVFTSRVTLTAADTIIARCRTRGGVTLRGARARMSRCYVDNAGTGDSVTVDGTDQRVDGNEITNFGNGIQVTDSARDPVIERNFIHDSNPAAPSTQDAAIYVGAGKGSSPVYVRAVIRYNRTERVKTHQHIELKCSGNLVLGNTGVGNIAGFQKANFYVRHGMDNVFALNWMLGSNCTNGASDERTHLIKVHGVSAARGGKLTGDTLRDTSLSQEQRSGIVFSEDAIICQPDGPVNLGYAEGANPQEEPRRTIIEELGGQPVVKSMPASTYTTRARTLTIPEGLFRELTVPNDVGQRWGQTLPPVKANPDTASTTAGTAVDIRPLANDTGSPIEITSWTQPPSGAGSVTSPAVGVLRFTPAAGFRGVAVFNYEASNGLTSDIDTITVEVR